MFKIKRKRVLSTGNQEIPPIILWLNKFDTLLMWMAKLALVCLTLLTFISVIGRVVFSHALPDDILLSELLMIAVVFLPLGAVQSKDGHLEVTVLTDMLKSKTQRRIRRWNLVLSILIAFGLAYLTFGEFSYSKEADEVGYASILSLRLWPVKAVLTFGIAWWTVRMIVQFIYPTQGYIVSDKAGKKSDI